MEFITEIGGRATQSIFDGVYEEEGKSIEAEEEDEWMVRFLQKMVIDDLIREQEASKIAKTISIQDQQLVRVMAEALGQALKMRALVKEGYSSTYMLDYVLNTFVGLAVDGVNEEVAERVWSLLEQLSMKFSSARRLAPVFSLVRQEIAESKDPAFASFVLIANLGSRRLDKLILKNLGSDDAEDTWWQA